MHLPESKGIDVSRLSAVFSDTTNSYKFYWFLAILDSLKETGQAKLSMQDLSLRMVASVWYPLDYFKLSFGKSDSFKSIATFVSQRMQVDNSLNAPNLLDQLRTHLLPGDLELIYTEVRKLLKYVPYRFIRPFFEQELRGIQDQYINRRIVELANQSIKAPYRFTNREIVLNDDWATYLQQHQTILRGFTQWHLIKFLQKHNPTVVGLSEKLDKPVVRVLNTANRFWKDYLRSNPDSTCIYCNHPISLADLSLDHFLP